MVFYLLIRGPLGIGKSTVSRQLATVIAGEYISIDQILDEPGVEEWDDKAGFYYERSFLRVNSLAVERTLGTLGRGTPVIYDGNFYWKSQIADLVARLNFPHFVFTLKAPLELCIQRDNLRNPPHGQEAAERVYAKSTEFDWGVGIDATQPVESMITEITSHISQHLIRTQP